MKILPICFILTFAHSFADDCNILQHCGNFLNKPPECKSKAANIELVRCLNDMLKHCETSLEILNLKRNTKIASAIFCSNKDLASEFYEQSHCWTPNLESCLNTLAEKRDYLKTVKNNQEVENTCKTSSTIMNDCASRNDIEEDCKAIYLEFLESVYEKLDCDIASDTTLKRLKSIKVEKNNGFVIQSSMFYFLTLLLLIYNTRIIL